MTYYARPGQSLAEHLNRVADLAKFFGQKFDSAEFCYIAGLLHDLGKAKAQWQLYLNGQAAKTSHAPESAVFCLSKLKDELGRLLAYAIKSHHAGLPDWAADLDQLGDQEESELERVYADIISLPQEEELKERLLHEIIKIFTPGKNNAESIAFWVRMLASALIDADRLDAEAHERGLQPQALLRNPPWEKLERDFDDYMLRKQSEAAPTAVNRIRREILQEVLTKADGKPGVYTLNVPTGGGKTLTSMAFAMRHRRANQLNRIIMAIPYNAIIEQTAASYKKIFGEKWVLEHHSAFELADRPTWRLAAENWDMPIIVTTNVQFFESLLKSSASRLRKLHNICGSVIILDEAQMLPREHLHALMTVLRSLVRDFGCSLVLCSATIPCLEGNIHQSALFTLEGLPQVTDLIAEPDKLAASLRRTEISHLGEKEVAEIAAELDKQAQALCIVNNKKDCQKLFEQLTASEKVMLSGNMCPADRQKRLAEVIFALKSGQRLVLVATSLVECGVDLDFPVVFRELAGIDSIAQAAGRCNREGRAKLPGKVYTFEFSEGRPPPTLQTAWNIAKEFIPQNGVWEMTPKLYRQYFTSYYARNNNFGQKEYSACFPIGFNFSFKTYSRHFNMINNSYLTPVVVWYEDSVNLIGELKENGPDRALLRKLQAYTVNVPIRQLEVWRASGCVENIQGLDVQASAGLYEERKGIRLSEENAFYVF
ncbi:MAG: CRISPR-associated helicase Cas3' [Lentisphaeria bacterium]|nr:CRISPR-associated helicase Cas3' [Lentisphaerota bacterium]